MPSSLPILPSAAAAAAAVIAFRFLRLRLSPSRQLPIPSPPLLCPSTKPISTTHLSSSSGSTMDGHRPSTLLLLAGKSSEENDLAQSLKSKSGTLKLGGEEEEEEIKILLQSEMDSITPPTFSSQLYMDALSTSRFGRLLIWSPRLSSTHNLVAQNFSELPLGTVCIADVQFKGRGRAKNVWESPEGCLLFSFTLQMEDGHKLPLLQYVVSLAVTEAIKESCRAKGSLQLDVRIKWPNDLYLDGLKVGGILCTSTYRSKKFNVCAGIGLNLDNEKPTTCLNMVLQKLSSGTNRLTREDILAAFFNKFENLFEIFLIQGDLLTKCFLFSMPFLSQYLSANVCLPDFINLTCIKLFYFKTYDLVDTHMNFLTMIFVVGTFLTPLSDAYVHARSKKRIN